MPASDEFGAQFQVVEDLAVADDRQVAIEGLDWLPTASEINDREPGVGQADMSVEAQIERIWTSVIDELDHRGQEGVVNGRLIEME